MGTIFTARTLTAAQVEAALTDPAFIKKLLYGEPLDDEDDSEDTVRFVGDDSFFEEDSRDVISVDLEKSWESVHLLLTTTAGPPSSPLSMAIMGDRCAEPTVESTSGDDLVRDPSLAHASAGVR